MGYEYRLLARFYGHTGTTFLTWGYLDESDWRWIEYDPVYEKMWKDMGKTVDKDVREGKIRQLIQHLHDRACALFIYSPLMLYAVNKEVIFVPQKNGFLRLKETSVTNNHWSVREEEK
jgi:hypothetical protein